MKRERKHQYSSDRPITKFPEDQLGRGAFARRLADDIHGWKGSDSLVIGLYGNWGSGKTSLKNLMLNALKRRKARVPILEFNPWQVSGTGGISATFFEELRIILRPKTGDSGEVIERAKKLNAYSKRLSLAGKATWLVSALLTGLGKPAEGVAAATAAEGMNQAADVMKAGSEAQEASAEGDELSLSELKKSLEDSLRKLKEPLLVVIDDIDRLTTREILDVFQLVKANADFPNLTYLLLFERSIVSKALDQVSDNRGKEFLEKIIQVGYHVPHASRASVQKVLFRGLDDLLALPGVNRRWNKDRWSEFYLDGLAPFFRNLRHIYRFLSSFDFHVRQFRTAGHFEVNPVDLIGLETLRVFEPDVFEQLVGAKRILTRDAGEGLFSKIEQEVVDTAVTDILGHATEPRREHVRHIIRHLFPPITSNYAGDHVTGDDSYQWLRDARVCHPDLFDQYFTLGVQEGELAQSELDRLIDSAGDSAEFVTQLRAFEKRGLLKSAFERLDAHKEDIPLEKMPELIRALSDVGDSFQEKEPGMFEIDLRMMAARLIYFGLRKENDEQRRLEILRDGFNASDGVFVPVSVTALQERRNDAERRNSEYLVSETQWNTLKELCLAKLKSAASEGRLRSHPHAAMLLWRWSDWAIDEARAWVAEQIKTQEGALWLLSVLLGEVHSHGRELKIHHYMKLGSVERFADVDAITTKIGGPVGQSLSEKETIAIREFHRALKRRAEGKPDIDGWAGGFGDD